MLPDNNRNDHAMQQPESHPTQGGMEYYNFNLYISGHTLRSIQAISSIQSICEKYLKERYTLRIVDVYQQPQLIQSERITAIPTLIKFHPLPLQRVVGDLTDVENVLNSLGLTGIS